MKRTVLASITATFGVLLYVPMVGLLCETRLHDGSEVPTLSVLVVSVPVAGLSAWLLANSLQWLARQGRRDDR